MKTPPLPRLGHQTPHPIEQGQSIDDIITATGDAPQEYETLGRNAVLSAIARHKEEQSRQGFAGFMVALRKKKALSLEELAERAGIETEDIKAIESCSPSAPSPRTIFRLEQFFGLPAKTLGKLSGAVIGIPSATKQHLVRFAACSNNLGSLTREEKSVLNAFVRYLSDNHNT